jgi:hypothetical protein
VRLRRSRNAFVQDIAAPMKLSNRLDALAADTFQEFVRNGKKGGIETEESA